MHKKLIAEMLLSDVKNNRNGLRTSESMLRFLLASIAVHIV